MGAPAEDPDNLRGTVQSAGGLLSRLPPRDVVANNIRFEVGRDGSSVAWDRTDQGKSTTVKLVTESEVPNRPPITGIGRHRSGRADVSERAEELLRRAARRRRVR